jgi:putative hydrolase of the HAD superfamily
MPPYDAVVFDLGGVLAELSGVARMRELAGMVDDGEVWRRWLACEWVRRFERGHCGGDDFAAGIVGDWALPIDADTFLTEFRDWLVGPYAGAEQLVADVRATGVTVACLSNTNRVHWEAGAQAWPLFSAFDRAFLSFEIGLVKPDAEVFAHMTTALDLPPYRVLFLDDNEVNVDGARAAGLAARRVQGVAEARETLEELGVIGGRVCLSPPPPDLYRVPRA